jgi:gamma-glutamyltranspeptidase/glutathione hydrolase
VKNKLTLVALLLALSATAQIKIDSANSIIASAHPLASEAGAVIFKQGGNAYDAITAAAFALSVVEPSMSGLGGRLQVIHRNSKGKIKGIDATTQVPASYRSSNAEPEDGYATIGVPGVVKGLVELHASNGKLPLETVMMPAIQLARMGFPVLKEEAERMRSVKKDLQLFASTKKHFFVADSLPMGGDLFKQPALATTLEQIAADQGKSFYQGAIASALVQQVQQGGGSLALRDLFNYQAQNATLLKGSYRGYEIYSIGMPSYGAIVIEMLQLLEQADLKNCNEKDFLLLHAKAHELAYEDKKFLKQDEQLLTKTTYATKRWKEASSHIADTSKMATVDTQNGHTTHLVAADKEGNMISLTQSLGPTMGSKVAADEGVFMLATTMGPYLGKMAAGERASSHISPVIIYKDGKPFLCLGAAGGARIVPAVVQTISRVIDRNLSLDQAIAAARVFQLADKLLIENHAGVFWEDNSTITELKKINKPIEVVTKSAQFGRVHAAISSATGKWIGAADPDWSGVVVGY